MFLKEGQESILSAFLIFLGPHFKADML